jgi:hypothetical protein
MPCSGVSGLVPSRSKLLIDAGEDPLIWAVLGGVLREAGQAWCNRIPETQPALRQRPPAA